MYECRGTQTFTPSQSDKEATQSSLEQGRLGEFLLPILAGLSVQTGVYLNATSVKYCKRQLRHEKVFGV